jgi:CDP-glucose 4,6-dehydratase
VTIARCGNIYGGGDLNWNRIVPGTIRSLLAGEQPVLRSDGTFLRDYLFVDDVIKAYLLLGEKSSETDFKGEAFNFSNEQPMTVMEIYGAICEVVSGRAVSPLILNRATGEIRDQYLDSSKSHRILDWYASVPLREGLERTVSWYREFLGQD